MKSGIVGGTSIIFQRYVEAGKTLTRNGTKLCKMRSDMMQMPYIYGQNRNGCLQVIINGLKHMT
jgi:hypothetical protein